MNLKEAAAVAKLKINDLIAPDTPQDVGSVLVQGSMTCRKVAAAWGRANTVFPGDPGKDRLRAFIWT